MGWIETFDYAFDRNVERLRKKADAGDKTAAQRLRVIASRRRMHAAGTNY